MSETRDLVKRAYEKVLTPEALSALMSEVLTIKKQGRGWCPNCNKAVPVEIADAKAVVSAMAELLTQAEGRPGTVEADARTVHEYRLIWEAPEDGAQVQADPDSAGVSS